MPVRTFTEAGRGRKKCPADGCPHYVPAVTKKCPCGHEFVKGAKPAGSQEPKEIKRHETGGRGKKQCPGCKLYVGAKTAKCPCGHTFTSTKPSPTATRVAAKLATAAAGTQTKPKPTPREPEPVQKSSSGVYPRTRRGIGIMRTFVPAGACPAKLKSTDKAEVYAWIERVLSAVENERHQLLQSAVKYYAREFFDVSAAFKATDKPSKYEIVCGHVDSYWSDGGGEPDQYENDLDVPVDDPDDVPDDDFGLATDDTDDTFEFED